MDRHEKHQNVVGDADAALGLPMLDELPELGELLSALRQVDRLIYLALEHLIRLQDAHAAEEITGVALGQWLAALGRRTRSDRRMLSTAAVACRRLPALRAAFRDARLSWAQVRSLALAIERIPRQLDARLDAHLDEALPTADADPDDLLRVVRWTWAELDPGAGTEPTPPVEESFVAMQPRLDGEGGSLYGEFDGESFALLDRMLNDGLEAEVEASRELLGEDAEPGCASPNAGRIARARAQRLLGVAASADLDRADLHRVDREPEVHGRADAAPRADRVAPRPMLLLRTELDTLLGASDRTAAALVHLTGGHMRVAADRMRGLVDRLGADIRLVVTDGDRGVVGVGRRRRLPPGWLREAILAVHDTCTAPGCQTAARLSQMDHARPWEAGGRTDADNLGPVCGTDNHRKESGGWRVVQHPDGAREWHHPRSGLRTRTIPGAPRPPTRDPAACCEAEHPTRQIDHPRRGRTRQGAGRRDGRGAAGGSPGGG